MSMVMGGGSYGLLMVGVVFLAETWYSVSQAKHEMKDIADLSS